MTFNLAEFLLDDLALYFDNSREMTTGIVPIIHELASTEVTQMWYADDVSPGSSFCS